MATFLATEEFPLETAVQFAVIILGQRIISDHSCAFAMSSDLLSSVAIVSILRKRSPFVLLYSVADQQLLFHLLHLCNPPNC